MRSAQWPSTIIAMLMLTLQIAGMSVVLVDREISSNPTATPSATTLETSASKTSTLASPFPTPSKKDAGLRGCQPGEGTGPGSKLCDTQHSLQCYALPYGLLGFCSDLTSLYTVVMLQLGRKPLMPWSRLKGGRWDMTMGVLSILSAVISAVINAARCGRHWELVAMSFWKITIAISMGSQMIHAALIAQSQSYSKYAFGKTNRAFVPYSIGLLIGTVGLTSLAFTNRVVSPVLDDTGVMYGNYPLGAFLITSPLFFMLVLNAIHYVAECRGALDVWNASFYGYIGEHYPSRNNPLYWPIIMIIYITLGWQLGTIFFGNWILALLAQNRIGVPSDSNRPIFIKKIPLLSI